MRYIQSIKPQKHGFTQRYPNTSSTTTSPAETMERLYEEIRLLAKDSRNFEEQYQMILSYYQNLTRKIKKGNLDHDHKNHCYFFYLL